MFASKLLSVGTTAVELTAGVDLDQPTRVRIKADAGPIAIGSDSSVTWTASAPLASTDGYRASGGEVLEFQVDGESVWAVAPNPNIPVSLLAWTE